MYSTVTSTTLLPCCRASYVCHGNCLLTAVGCARCVSCTPALTKQDESAIDPRADNYTSVIAVVVQQFRAFLISYVYVIYSILFTIIRFSVFFFCSHDDLG